MVWKSLAFTDVWGSRNTLKSYETYTGPSEQSFCKKCSQNRRNPKESQGAGRQPREKNQTVLKTS